MLYALLFTTDHSVDNAYSLRSAAISPPENSKGGQMLGTQPVITSDLKFGTLGDVRGAFGNCGELSQFFLRPGMRDTRGH